MTLHKKYRHLFFDLDRTLWDFDANSHEALLELYGELKIENKGFPAFEYFYSRYKEVNLNLWDIYRKGEISREYLSLHRFLNTLRHFGIDDKELAMEMSTRYVQAVSEKTFLFPGTKELLSYLKDGYTMHILTNGFADVQYRKLDRSGLRKYFDQIITSEEAGMHKPDIRIFQHAMKSAMALPEESLMIGDDPEVDLLGAKNAGMDQLFVNHENTKHHFKFTHEVKELPAIQKIL